MGHLAQFFSTFFFILKMHLEPGVVAHACNCSAWEVETGSDNIAMEYIIEGEGKQAQNGGREKKRKYAFLGN